MAVEQHWKIFDFISENCTRRGLPKLLHQAKSYGNQRVNSRYQFFLILKLSIIQKVGGAAGTSELIRR